MTRFIAFLSLSCSQPVAASISEEPLLIGLQPFASVSRTNLSVVKDALQKAFNCDVAIMAVKPLPTSAYYPPRSRYRAEKLLSFLETSTPKQYDKIVGITSVDISTTGDKHYDWGIFGLGSIGGRSCVISDFRLKKGADALRKQVRLQNVALHEVGHTLGLNHCPSAGCLMRDAGGSIKSVEPPRQTPCKKCRQKLGQIYR